MGHLKMAVAPLTKEMIPQNPDTNGDGELDAAEIAVLDAIILGK